MLAKLAVPRLGTGVRLTPRLLRSILRAVQIPRGSRGMAISVTPIHPHIGAEIGGVDVSRPPDPETLAELWRAIDRHAVLVFHDQAVTDQQLHDFAACFGELEIG